MEKAVGPKDKEIAQLKATVEKMKAMTRSTEGPNTAHGTAGGGRPTIEQYKSATPEQRKKWRENGVEVLI